MGEVCGRRFPGERAPLAVMVGEGPGAEEVSQGLPFKGSTGMQLEEAMTRSGLNRGSVALLNAMACRPPPTMKTNENLRDATAACRGLFLHQYERYAKLPTLAMGKWASAAANGGKPVTVETGRGFIRDQLLVTWHPTYAFFHNPWKAGEFLNDLERFKRMIDGTLEREPKVIIKPTMQDMNRFLHTAKLYADELRALAGATLPPFQWAMASDIETRPDVGRPDYEGKDPTRAAMKSISMGTPDLSVAHWWGNGERGVESTFVKWLGDSRILKIGHNWWFFDDRVIKRLGIAVRNVIDTRDLRRAVSATSRLSLRFLTSITTDYKPWKETEDDK